MKKNLYIYTFLTLFLLNCSDKEDRLKTPIKKIKIESKNGNVLVLGEIKNDTVPHGLWTFYNSNEKLILELEFNDANNLSIKQYTNDGKIIYDAYYINGELLEEKKCLDFEKINYDNGRYLFNKYLDVYFNNEFGRIKSGTLDLKSLKFKINILRNKYKNIPPFNDNEIKAILFFFNPNGANVKPSI